MTTQLRMKLRPCIGSALLCILLAGCASEGSGDGSGSVGQNTAADGSNPVFTTESQNPAAQNQSSPDNPLLNAPLLDPLAGGNPGNSQMSEITLTVALPNRILNLATPIDILVTVGGGEYLMQADANGFTTFITLPRNRSYPLFIAVRREFDELLLAAARTELLTDAAAIPLTIPAQEFDTDFDSDSDGFTNITEIERGTSPTGLTEDFDGDGVANETDLDDDNDGILDTQDAFPLNADESLDTDGDGIGNTLDYDDDNDLYIDDIDLFPLNPDEALDTDLDTIGNNADTDDDGDGVIDIEDLRPLDPTYSGNEDSDADGYRDRDDAFPDNPNEFNDVDGDGIGDNADPDDDNNGVPDDQENALVAIPYTQDPPIIDGAYGADEWLDATSADNRGNRLLIDHLLVDNNGTLIDQDPNIDHRWRAMHDGRYLYVLVLVNHEPFYERFDDSDDIWLDDGIELFFDTGNEGATSFDQNDFQVLLRYNYLNPESVVRGFNSAYGLWVSYCSNLNLETPQTLHTYYEAKISLSSIGLAPGQRFGIEVQINEDDDGGDRDAKFGWHAPANTDTTWQNPSHLGTAILVPAG